MNEKLKPCPFCGLRPGRITEHTIAGHKHLFITCPNEYCGASMTIDAPPGGDE